ncbi:hypothetical protein MTO96_041604 [Rhipicephalus appendiculatus]
MSKEIRSLFDDLKRELRAEFKDFKDTIERDFRKEFRDIKTSLAHAYKEYEDIKVENKELKESNAKLHVLCSDLLHQIKDHECRILQAEQYSRRANVEIKGIPYSASLNLTEVVTKMCEQIGVPILASHIARVHWVPTAKDAAKKNVVVQFLQRQKRDGFLKSARSATLKCSDVGIDSRAALFVKEHLCPELKRLLGRATARKHEANWKYVWVRDGKIFARQADGSPRIRIQNGEDVDKMVNLS